MSQFVSNKDVSPNAEIEGTKIVSDFGNQDIFADGYIALGLVPSDIGSVRLTNNTKVAFRSFDNLSNIEALFVDTSNKLVIGHGSSNVDFKVGSGIAIPITPETVSTWAVVQDGYALIAAGGGTRAVWGPAGLDNGMVVDNIADLRMLTDADATMVNVTGHAPGTRLGGGFFTWNPLPKPDDNGLRFNAGGIGSNTAGWDRIILADSDLNVTWFGAQLDGIADDTGALASTVDAALLDGYRRVYIPQGTLRYTSTLTIDTDHVSIYGSNLTDENGLVAGTILQYDGAGAGILIGRNIGASLTATYHTTLRGFTLKVPTTCSHAIRAWCPAYLRIDSVNVIGMIGNTRYGIMVEQGVDVEIRNCNVTGDNLTYDADRTTYANGIDIRHALGSPSTTTRVDKCYLHRCYESLTVYGSFAHSTDTIMEGGFRGFLCNGGRLALASCWIENCGVTSGAAAGYLTTSSEAHLVACNIVGYTDPQYVFNVVGTARLILEGGQIASDHGTPGLINPGDYTYGSGYVSVTDVDIASDISYGINYLATGGVQDRARRFVGDNDPAGVVYGNVGDLFQRNNGGAGTSLYIKESGTNTTSGWRAIISNDGYADGMLASSVTELRALTNDDAQTVVLESYGPTYAGGGGTFYWDPNSSIDDGVTRFNAGGLASNSAGWQRVERGPVRLSWAGVVGDGVADDTAAVNRAIAAAVVYGGVVKADTGLYRLTSTVTISSAVTVMGEGAAPAGGIQDNANAFPTFLHDFDGYCFLFNGAVGGVAASGGGLENLRIVQTYGTVGNVYGPAIRVAGVDASHRPAWLKFRALVIEETGDGAWEWAFDFDGYTAALPDMFIGEITSHTDNTAAQGAGAMRVDGVANLLVYNSTLFLGERGIVMGETTESGSCQFTNVHVSGNSTFDNAHDFAIVGGTWSDLLFTANVTGRNTVIPGRLAGTITNLADLAVGTLHYDPYLEFQGQDYGAFRTNRFFSVPNNRWYLGERTTPDTAYALIGLDGENSARVLPYGEVPIVLGSVVTTTVGQPAGSVIIGSGKNIRSENAAQSGYYPLIGSNASDQVEIGDASRPLKFHGSSILRAGAGSPEGVVAGNVGDEYHRTDGYAGFTLYIKETGTGTTGWRSLSSTTNTEVTEVRYLAATAGGDVATEGAVRLASGDSIEFRDSSNTVNVTGIGLDASDNLTIGDDLLPGNIIIGDPAMPGQVIINSGISASTRIDGYDAFVATVETSTTWASALDGYVAVVAGSGSRVEWAAISASIITSGGANQVLWSNGVSNVWTSTPVITNLIADGYVKIGAGASPTTELLRVNGQADVEQVIVNTPAGAITDIMTWRRNNVVVADITATGALEARAISFQSGLDTPGGGGEVAENFGGALVITCGVSGNGNIVASPLAGGALYIQPGAVATHQLQFDSNGITLLNAKTLYWKDTGGTAREILRGDSGNIVSFGTLGGGYTFRNQAFAAKILSLSETGTYLYFDKAVPTPVFYQETDTTNGITGDTFTIQAQNATGTTTTGGILKLQSGTGTTAPGSIQLWVGANQSAQFGRNASDFLAFGDEPADTGTIRFSHLSNIVGEAVTPGTDVPLLEWGTYISGRLSVGHSSIGVLHLRAGTTAILNGSNANIWSASTDINVYVSNEQWAESVSSPQILQLTRGSDAAVQNFTITPQAPYGSASVNTKGGDLVVALASPVGGGTAEASFKITRGGAFYAAIGKADSAAYTRLWMGPSLTPSASNYALQSNGSSTFINGISEVNFAISGVNYAIFTGALFEWTQGVTTPTIGQATRTSGAPQNMLIAPQPPDGAASGANRRPGSLVVSLAAPTNGGTDEAALVVNRGGSHYVSIGPRVSDSARSAIYLTPGVTPTTLNYTVAADASSTILNSNGSSFLVAFSGVNKLTIGTYYLQWAYDVASPIFNQGTDATNGVTGDTFTIQAQSTSGTTSTGGSLKLQSGTGTSAAGSVQLFAGTSQVGQFGAASGDYLAFGADPADSGTIRFSAGATIKGEANPTGTDATILTYTDQTALEVGSSGITTTTISGTTVEINGASATLIEAVEIAAGRRVVSLVLGADLTTTEMPASTGDRVVFVANAATNPSANPVGGFILYADNGQPTFRTSDGYTLTVGSVDVGGANEVYWSNGSTNSWTGAPTITSLNASSYVSVGSSVATAGVVRIGNATAINARNAANSANINLVSTDASNNIFLGANSAVTYLDAGNTVYIRFGGSTAATFNASNVLLTQTNLQWTQGTTSPLMSQQAKPDDVSGAPQNMKISAQYAFATASGANRTPGSLLLDIGIPTNGSTVEGFVKVTRNSTVYFSTGALPGNTTYASVWLGPSITPSSSNYTFAADGSSIVILNSPGSLAFYTNGTSPQMILSAALFQWYQNVSSPIISHAAKSDDSAAPTNFTIRGQYPYASASTEAKKTPGSVIADVGVPTNSGTTEAGFKVTRNGTLHCQIGAYNTPPSYSSVWLGPGITPSTTNFAFLGDGTSLTYLNAPSGGTVFISLAGSGAYGISVTSTILQFNSTETLQWVKGATAPLLKQVIKDANETPRNITIEPQAPWNNASCTGVNRYPGHLVVALAAPVQSATTEASLKITRGGTFAAALGPLTDGYGTTNSALWLVPGTTPTWQNWQVASSSTLLGINAYSTTGSIQFMAGGNYVTNLSYTGNMSWYRDVIPMLSQETQPGDYATNNFEIRAQGAYASASTNKNGGDLLLKSGAEASGGLGGALKLYIGAQGMMELREVASGRNIIALCTTGVTTTEMPANTGNMVIYIANCSTVPTGNPTSGGILYVDDGNLYWRDPSGVSTQLN